jgi:uncharacterized protein (TIGR03435 family)
MKFLRPFPLSIKWMSRTAAFALIFGAAVFAQVQGVTGIWQGTLSPPGANRDQRIMFKISEAAGQSLQGAMYSIDQGGQSMAISKITVDGSTIKIAVPGMGGTYEGTLSADGSSIKGNWKQGPMPLPLNLVHVSEDAAYAIPAPLKQMAADADPAFEVATIKPSNPDASGGKGFTLDGRQLSTVNTTVSDLISWAYGVHARQIIGAPDWIGKEKYDLLGEPDIDGQPNRQQAGVMIQKLLADRFKLSFHSDKKELSVYAIVVGKDGPKITKSPDQNGLPRMFLQGHGVLPVKSATMAEFADVLQGRVLDLPVVDQTGLAGRYDFILTWTPDESQFGGLGAKPPVPSDDATAPPDLFTAIQQQLGLKLEAKKASADVLVIDHVERPSPN